VSPLDVSSSPNQRWLAKEFASSLEQSHRTTRQDVHGYVELAKHLSESPGPEPDPDFRAALRHRLLHELVEDELLPRQDELAVRRDDRVRRKGGSHCFERSPREPWIAAASTVLVVCGGAVGLGQNSGEALPSDVLYPVKRFFEAGEMAIANSPEGQARELMEQASERLDEAQALVGSDEIHEQQALPATIVDFTEAVADAGDIIIVAQSQDDVLDPALISEFQAFSSTSRTVLDEIATTADADTAALIDQAHSMLDGFDELLPILDPLLSTSDDLPIASEALNATGLDGHHQGGGSSETSIEPASDSVGLGDDDRSDPAPTIAIEDAVAPVTDTVEGTTTALGNTVQVIELSAAKHVSMAVATVKNTVKAVDQAVQQTTETVDQTVQETVAAVDETVGQAADALQQTAGTLQQTAESLSGLPDATSGGLLSAQTGG
jgi:Domain of unknown function (DUF5667)